MRKYTHILLASFVALFIGLMIITTTMLKHKIAVFNFKDEYRHFIKNENKYAMWRLNWAGLSKKMVNRINSVGIA